VPASPNITPLEQLALVPLRNAKVRLIEDAPARVLLEVDAVYPRWLGPLPRWLGAKKVKRIALDGLSLMVWRRIDDRINLGGLIDWLAAEQQLEFNEARLLTLQFLRLLSLRGLIVLGDRTGIS
jgi:hypothetical protein